MLTAIWASQEKGYQYDRFRRSFHLNFYEKQNIKEKGFILLEKAAIEIISNRLRVKPCNDGKQTPYRGHPVFKAQHATACCCRKCIQKWHHIPSYKELDDREMKYLVNVVMVWLKKEMKGVA